MPSCTAGPRPSTSASGAWFRTRRTASARSRASAPAWTGPEREQLVGLRPLDPAQPLVAGAHVVEPGAEPVSANDLGYLTSACHSPTLGHAIALGFVRDGRARHGARVRAVCRLRGLDVACEIVPPVFFDPEGGRLRG